MSTLWGNWGGNYPQSAYGQNAFAKPFGQGQQPSVYNANPQTGFNTPQQNLYGQVRQNQFQGYGQNYSLQTSQKMDLTGGFSGAGVTSGLGSAYSPASGIGSSSGKRSKKKITMLDTIQLEIYGTCKAAPNWMGFFSKLCDRGEKPVKVASPESFNTIDYEA